MAAWLLDLEERRRGLSDWNTRRLNNHWGTSTLAEVDFIPMVSSCGQLPHCPLLSSPRMRPHGNITWVMALRRSRAPAYANPLGLLTAPPLLTCSMHHPYTYFGCCCRCRELEEGWGWAWADCGVVLACSWWYCGVVMGWLGVV